MSGSVEVAFCSRGISSCLIVVDLERIRERYLLPNGFSLAVHFGDASRRQPGCVTLYEDTLIAGLHLPLHLLARDMLIFLVIVPSQLAPNGWRFLMGAIHLWPHIFGYKLTLQEFLWTY